MSTSIIDSVPLFRVRAQVHLSATAQHVYSVVSDLGRCGDWSPECTGGEWVSGDPSAVGSVFRGRNFRRDDVVGWAPLVRGVWHTECQVVEAEPGRTFQWAMRTHVGENQDSLWGFDMAPEGAGCTLVHHFQMGLATEGIHHIVADLDETARKQFVVDWTAKLEDDLAVTLARIKELIDQ